MLTACPQVKRMVVPDALKVLRLQHGHRYCQLGALAASVGWKHKEAVEQLEAKRKAKVGALSLCRHAPRGDGMLRPAFLHAGLLCLRGRLANRWGRCQG